MKSLVLLPILASLNAAEINVSDKIKAFTLPEQTEFWAESIMDCVRDVLPGDQAVQDKFQELVNWSCGEHADLKSTDKSRREETIRLSLDRLVAMTTSSARVAYIEVQLERHKKYVPKK